MLPYIEKLLIYTTRHRPMAVLRFVQYMLRKPKSRVAKYFQHSKKFDIGSLIVLNLHQFLKPSTGNLLTSDHVCERIINTLSPEELVIFPYEKHYDFNIHEDALTTLEVHFLNLQERDGKFYNMLHLMIRASSSNMIWKYMEKILPKEESHKLLKKRLKVLLLKDSNGMTIIDYGFLCNRYVVGEYVRGIVSLIGTDEIFQEITQGDEDKNYSVAK